MLASAGQAKGRVAVLAMLGLAGCAGIDRVVDEIPAASPTRARSPARPGARADPVVTQALLRLVGEEARGGAAVPPPSRSLEALAEAGTPEALRLWSRYSSLGELVAAATQAAGDPMVDDRTIEIARWGRPESRAAAMLALARRRRPEDRRTFEEALIGTDPRIHFALAQALEAWDLPEGRELLIGLASGREVSAVRVYAAQALARRKEPAGLAELRRQLDNGDWLARAMSARYLGLFGEAADYQLLLDRLTREQGNDFVGAEIAVSALRLFPASQAALFPPIGGSQAKPLEDSELEPLIVTAPRLKIPPTALIDGRINALLMRLLEERAEASPPEPDFGVLTAAVSPEAIRLRTRYGRLGFILADGLAGTTDLLLRERLQRVAKSASNGRIRAAALLALAYGGDGKDRPAIDDALLSDDTAVRLGAIEAHRVWSREARATPGVPHIRIDDPLAEYLAGGAISASRWIDDPDWVIRALALRSGNFAPDRLVVWLSAERNPFLRAELVIALLQPAGRR